VEASTDSRTLPAAQGKLATVQQLCAAASNGGKDTVSVTNIDIAAARSEKTVSIEPSAPGRRASRRRR
jgi:hypothetical protein